MQKFKPLIFTLIVLAVIGVVNPYIMDAISNYNTDTYLGQLENVDQYAVRRANRIPGLVYLGETILILGMFVYSLRKAFR